MFTIGIDVGGTHIRAAAVDADGRIFRARRAPTPRNGDGLVDWIALAVRQIQEEAERGVASAVGLALPGILDAKCASLIRSVNLPFLEGRPIREELAGRTGLAVTVLPDADAATWGEYSVLIPPPACFIHLRLGTGVACGIVAEDQLRPTDPDRNTHWRVLVVDDRPGATFCSCGLRGCLETIASGLAIEQRATSLGCRGGLAELQSAWERSEPSARMLIEDIANAIASAIGNLKSQISDRLVVCLGGGVVQVLPCILGKTEERLHSLRDSAPGGVALIPARLGDDAGVIGAGLLAAVVSPRWGLRNRGNR